MSDRQRKLHTSTTNTTIGTSALFTHEYRTVQQSISQPINQVAVQLDADFFTSFQHIDYLHKQFQGHACQNGIERCDGHE